MHPTTTSHWKRCAKKQPDKKNAVRNMEQAAVTQFGWCARHGFAGQILWPQIMIGLAIMAALNTVGDLIAKSSIEHR